MGFRLSRVFRTMGRLIRIEEAGAGIFRIVNPLTILYQKMSAGTQSTSPTRFSQVPLRSLTKIRQMPSHPLSQSQNNLWLVLTRGPLLRPIQHLYLQLTSEDGYRDSNPVASSSSFGRSDSGSQHRNHREKDRSIIRGRLEALRDNGPEMTVYLDGPEVTIGRARDMDIVTLDDGISRAHAIFQRHEQGYRIRDCGSGNGTYLNGKSIDVAELYDDDIITLGRLQLRYHTIGWTRPRRRKKSAVALTLTETLAVETNRSPITNLVAGFLSAVVGVMIASLLSQSPQVDHKPAIHWYDQAKVSAQFEKWTEAAEELEIARGLGLKEQRYVPLAKSIQRAIVDQRVLEQLTQGMESGLGWFQVQKLAERINESSVYWPQRQLLLERLKRTFVERWSRAAYRSYMAGNTKKLKRLLGHIRDTDPNHATLTALTRYSKDHSK